MTNEPLPWLPTLLAPTPQAGFELAIKLARIGVELTQPNDVTRHELRAVYQRDADALIAFSHVNAAHFQTVAAANNWWRA